MTFTVCLHDTVLNYTRILNTCSAVLCHLNFRNLAVEITIREEWPTMTKAGTHLYYYHPQKVKGNLLNDMRPLICEIANGLKVNVCCSNVLHHVVSDLIHFTSVYWYITGLCHLRSLTGTGDSLVPGLPWQQIPSTLMLLHNPQAL